MYDDMILMIVGVPKETLWERGFLPKLNVWHRGNCARKLGEN